MGGRGVEAGADGRVFTALIWVCDGHLEHACACMFACRYEACGRACVVFTRYHVVLLHRRVCVCVCVLSKSPCRRVLNHPALC